MRQLRKYKIIKEMTPTIPKQLLCRLSELITPLMGLHFPEARWGDLERGIVSAAREFGFTDTESLKFLEHQE